MGTNSETTKEIDTPKSNSTSSCIYAQCLTIHGVVQGVGMRPFIYRKATQQHLRGWVKNTGNHVDVFVQGTETQLENFLHALHGIDLPLVIVTKITKESAEVEKSIISFSIIKSDSQIDEKHPLFDYATCKQCQTELLSGPENKKPNRRYLYAFTSCTNCGPRHSILREYPLDRENTSFDDFPTCIDCSNEYADTKNRRFHAQNISCKNCGPVLFTHHQNSATENMTDIQNHCTTLLKAGKIIAIKSSSGYKLICDATNANAIKKLRERKKRPHKPFAIMFPDTGSIRHFTEAKKEDLHFLNSKENPILIVNARKGILPYGINPSFNTIGACLPGTPLEHLLLIELDRPVIVTSGNGPAQSIISNPDEAECSLIGIADHFIHHNLKITHALDDSVWKNINKKPHPIRLAKGYAPFEFQLPVKLKEPVIAFGAQMKNTIAIAWENRVIISAHLGNTSNFNTWKKTLKEIEILKKHYNVLPSHYLVDNHNGYTSHQWVRDNFFRQNFSYTKILHHHAHASAVASTMPANEPCLAFTWDGTGLGENDQLWGGETFIGGPGHWRRVASIREFSLPGSSAAIKQPWRIAASLLWYCDLDYEAANLNRHIQNRHMLELTHVAWEKKINAPLTSSIGRLFDGAASILGLLVESTFEGHAAMLLEAHATDPTEDFISLSASSNSSSASVPAKGRDNKQNLYIGDWEKLILLLNNNDFSSHYRATVFHNSLAQFILDQCLFFRRQDHVNNVGLSGGVFQNSKLVELTCILLKKHKFNYFLCNSIPCNDAQISFGQIIEYASQQEKLNLSQEQP